MKRITFASIVVACTLSVVALVWACSQFSVRKVADGYLVLGAKQAKECEEGGGCEIFSVREFEMAVKGILGRMQQRQGSGGLSS
jgi:hypothetical protein